MIRHMKKLVLGATTGLLILHLVVGGTYFGPKLGPVILNDDLSPGKTYDWVHNYVNKPFWGTYGDSCCYSIICTETAPGQVSCVRRFNDFPVEGYPIMKALYVKYYPSKKH